MKITPSQSHWQMIPLHNDARVNLGFIDDDLTIHPHQQNHEKLKCHLNADAMELA